MKSNITNLLALLAPLTLATGAYAQGPLTPPPGAPAPVMKSLDQIEARTPLVAGQPGVAISAAGTITISQPGSYYLTGNVTITSAAANGITVSSSNVTVDLNGFALICTSVDGGTGVSLVNASNVRITNGHILGGTTVSGSTFTLAGWYNGIISTSEQPGQVATDIDVIGTRNHGISLSYQGSRAERCSSFTTGGYGIHASSISFCTARKAGSHAIFNSSDPDSSSVDSCFGETVGNSSNGINSPDGNVSNSRGTAIGGNGVTCRNAINSTGVSTSSTGLLATMASNCSGTSTSGTGLFAAHANNCIGTSTSGTYGLSVVTGTASFCRGTRPGGTAIHAGLAIGCTTGGGTITASISKQLGTP
ncbi:MAG: hypothetical protein V4640_16060 [Verrucomicrobiota bacterium]